MRLDSSRQSCDSWNSKNILSYLCFSCLLSLFLWKPWTWWIVEWKFLNEEGLRHWWNKLTLLYCSFNSPIHYLIVYNGTKFIFVRWTCRGKVFSLNYKEIIVNLLGVISVRWNEKLSSSFFLSLDFLLHHHRGRSYHLFAQTFIERFMQSMQANRQPKAGVVNILIFSFVA